jgi:hypothetical protein
MAFPVTKSFVLFQMSGILHQHIAKSCIVAPFRLVADDVFLTEFFSFYHDGGHGKKGKVKGEGE